VIEALALRHVDERDPVAPSERLSVAKPHVHGGHHVLHHRFDRERQETGRPPRHAAAARLVTRKAGAIQQEHICTGLREPVGGRGAGGARAHDDGVVALHLETILTIPGASTL
jgi:hypothetical protein